ncbi:general stress protein 26 [Motilibacter rhizosphaerae]|uniref:General stress protein 26 n=1 Tax=Motilibacter rhizosphaerae TaxID=598652 RepID=A0A4Q7NB59_9ACTN|nr:pyridoxamine 5'-phosphate oxidase family protein [Motilibacter rhizosphaerae]RZS80125.1 general stress protein 26 [Motilibacter rhizosphaerae]
MADEQTGADKVTELAKDIRVGMLTTVDPSGTLVARPMAQQDIESAGELWFFAERDSRKVAHLTANPTAMVTLTSSDAWISLTGTGSVVDDVAKKRELWNPYAAAWLPQGPEDDSVVLIRFDADTAEYWDTPGGRIASVLSFAKAKVTGQRYEGGENERVEL